MGAKREEAAGDVRSQREGSTEARRAKKAAGRTAGYPQGKTGHPQGPEAGHGGTAKAGACRDLRLHRCVEYAEPYMWSWHRSFIGLVLQVLT